MTSVFSKDPSFKNQDPCSAIECVSARLAVFPNSTDVFVSGSCVRIAKNLYITARHVIEDFQKQFSVDTQKNLCTFWLIHVFPGPKYYIWAVDRAWMSPHTDIAIMYTKPYNDIASTEPRVKCVSLNLAPPSIGDSIVGFGHHSSKGKIRIGADGIRHIEINTKGAAAVGEVKEIHYEKRDNIRLPFPCYRVNARFDGGMSGGPIFNDAGQVCGVVCSNLPPSNEYDEHISYVATLWPMMGIMINISLRGESTPPYPLLELAKKGVISAIGWKKVNFNTKEGRISFSTKLNKH